MPLHCTLPATPRDCSHAQVCSAALCKYKATTLLGWPASPRTLTLTARVASHLALCAAALCELCQIKTDNCEGTRDCHRFPLCKQSEIVCDVLLSTHTTGKPSIMLAQLQGRSSRGCQSSRLQRPSASQLPRSLACRGEAVVTQCSWSKRVLSWSMGRSVQNRIRFACMCNSSMGREGQCCDDNKGKCTPNSPRICRMTKSCTAPVVKGQLAHPSDPGNGSRGPNISGQTSLSVQRE